MHTVVCRARAEAKHYTGRGVMKFYPSGEDLAKDMGIPLQTLVDTHQKHFEAAKKQEKDPDTAIRYDDAVENGPRTGS